MDKYIGRLLDNRYEILEVIGVGGMAVVYKARCHRLNRMVAVKILKDDYLQDEEFRERFHAESQAVAMLSHPNIVSVYDVSTSIMADYIVMELIEGISLKQYMEKKGVLNWKETLHFAIQIAKALEHAHGRGIVHRDIKPHNVMVLKNGSVKVTDFGIARVMSKGNTLTKEALGSVHYISPEQARGGRLDNRSDIYSLGVVMYEMMTGRPPFDGNSPVSVAIQHINGGAVMPSTLNPNIPGGLEQIIMKAMSRELVDRYSSASRMLSDMDEFRKDPSLLFDYNVPPLDAVTAISRQLPPEETVKTTAQRIAEGKAPVRISTQTSQTSDRIKQKSSAAQRQREIREEQRRNRVATIAIISCSLVAIIAVGIFLITLLGDGWMQPKEIKVDVPQLEGQVYEQLPEHPSLDIVREETYDDSVPAGMIIRQNPQAGDLVAEGSKVIVTVSMGPAPKVVHMESLENVVLNRAENYLKNLEMDLKVKVEQEYSDTIAEGNVIRTEPQKDMELTEGQEVTLWVSLGKEIKKAPMPGVVGETASNATNILQNQGLDLRVSPKEVYDALVPAGYVVRTDPEKGVELTTGQTVILYVSQGPETGKMPNCLGLDIEKATNILIAAGFNTPTIERVESGEEKDVVVRQSEEANTQVDISKEIVLEISMGKKDVTQDVVIDLQGSAKSSACKVEVKRNGQVVFSEDVKKGTKTVTVPSQTGSGSVQYDVIINDDYGWQELVTFTTDG